LYQLVAKDDDVTPTTWLISARSEDAAWRFACRRFLPRELWLGTGDYAQYQAENGAPAPAAGLTPAQQEAYLDAMSKDEFEQRLGASFSDSLACGGESYVYSWMGEVQTYVADE
jgi:hypothetical protein